jgi:hypothetical protein
MEAGTAQLYSNLFLCVVVASIATSLHTEVLVRRRVRHACTEATNVKHAKTLDVQHRNTNQRATMPAYNIRVQ